MRHALTLLALALGCSPGTAQLEACYARADAAKLVAAETRCPKTEDGSIDWATCPYADEIRKEHWVALERCDP